MQKNIGLCNKRRNMRIGLLGGSFDPAHDGHLYISKIALKLFNLNEVWWLVTPQNPLKLSKSSSLTKRINKIYKVISGKKIRVESADKRYRTIYTYHTLKKLLKSHPGNKFIWIMGADNLKQIHKWHNWKNIFNTLPVAVFNREGYSKSVMNSVAANYYHQNLFNRQGLTGVFKKKLPVWAFVRYRTNTISSTKIRNISGTILSYKKKQNCNEK